MGSLRRKKPVTKAEDVCLFAQRTYDRMIDNVKQGIVNRHEICSAMDALNLAHRFALKENKRNLLI